MSDHPLHLLPPGKPQVKLQHVKELVCMEQRADMLAVGSVGHVTLLDPRRCAKVGEGAPRCRHAQPATLLTPSRPPRPTSPPKGAPLS